MRPTWLKPLSDPSPHPFSGLGFWGEGPSSICWYPQTQDFCRKNLVMIKQIWQWPAWPSSPDTDRCLCKSNVFTSIWFLLFYFLDARDGTQGLVDARNCCITEKMPIASSLRRVPCISAGHLESAMAWYILVFNPPCSPSLGSLNVFCCICFLPGLSRYTGSVLECVIFCNHTVFERQNILHVEGMWEHATAKVLWQTDYFELKSLRTQMQMRLGKQGAYFPFKENFYLQKCLPLLFQESLL